MSPPLPALVQFGIIEHLTDEGVILLLGRGRIGDLPLTNLITGVDPFNIEPLNSSEELWYSYKSENAQYPNRRNAIIETKSGFWRKKDVCRIFTDTTWVVRKTTMVFYKGKVPFGNITRWMMYEYRAEKEKLNGFGKEKEHNSFCRVFMQNYQTDYVECQYSAGGECVMQLLPIFQEQEQLPSIDDILNRFLGQSTFAESLDEPVNEIAAENINASCDFVIADYLELNDILQPDTFSGQRSVGEQGQQSLSGSLDVPLNEIVAHDDFLEMNDLCNPEVSSIPWSVSVDEQQQSAFSESPAKSFNKNIAEDIYATDEFSNGDYLQLNDLCSQGTSSFSSDNSSRMSIDSYDYFDVDVLLHSRDEDNLRVEELPDCRFSISMPAESSQVVIGTPQSGVVHGDSDTVAEESKLVSSLPGKGISCQGLPTSNDELHYKRNDPKAGKSEGIQTKQPADILQGGSSMQGKGLKRASKIAMLGKKYCCFGSF